MKSKSKYTKAERAIMRELATEAWDAELNAALSELYEEFCRWAEHGMSSFELSDRIHAFHDGIARELYKRYTILGTSSSVARAVALGLIRADALPEALAEKLATEIAFFRGLADELSAEQGSQADAGKFGG